MNNYTLTFLNSSLKLPNENASTTDAGLSMQYVFGECGAGPAVSFSACRLPGKPLPRTAVVVHAATTGLIALSSLLCNILVFVLFYNRRILLSISNRFVVNLAVSNLLFTLSVTPSVLVSSLGGRWLLGHAWCIMSAVLTTAFAAVGVFTLVLISIDRYLAVSNPLRYRLLMTIPRSAALISGAWVLAFVVASPPTFGWSTVAFQVQTGTCTVYWQGVAFVDVFYTVILLALCCLGPSVIMLWVYGKIFRAAKKTSARARQNSITPDYVVDNRPTENPTLHSSSSTPALGQQVPATLPRRPSSVSLLNARRPSSASLLTNATRRRSSTNLRVMSVLLVHRDDRKAVRTGVLVVSTYVLCWVTYFTEVAVSAFAADVGVPGIVRCAALWLALLSCLLNPVVYVFRNKTVRTEIKNILLRRTSTLQVLDLINGRENAGESRRGSRELTKTQLQALYSANPKFKSSTNVLIDKPWSSIRDV